MLLGANLAVASIFMQGCKAVKPHGGDQPPPAPAVDQPQPTKTALENDIETTALPPPPPVKRTEVKPLPPPPPPAKHTEVKPLPPPPPEQPAFETYVVKKGDMLSKICATRGIRQRDVVKLNPGLDPNRIYADRKIKLPVAGAAPVPAPQPEASGAKAAKLPPPPPKKQEEKKADAKPAAKGTAANVKAPVATKAAYKPYDGPTKEYVVKSGDQLKKIANSYGISLRALKELNGLSSDNLKIGQKLKVPAEKVKPEEKKEAPAADAAKKEAKPEAEVKAEKAPAPAKEEKPEAEAAVKSDKPEAETAEKKEAAPAPAPAFETYTVKKGEDLVSIAINFGVSPSALMDLNDIKDADSVAEGQVLKIPAGATKAP